MIYLMVRASGRPRDPRQDRRRAQPERGQHGRTSFLGTSTKKKKLTGLSLHSPKANRYGISASVPEWAGADTRPHADAADVEMVRVRLRLR